MTNKLYVLGLGIEPIDHATVEVLQAVGRSDVLFCQSLGDESLRFLERFCPDRRTVEADTEASAARVLAELEAGKTAGFATRAHPFLFSALAGRLVRACEEKGIAWQSFGAVSSMGLAMALTGRTLGEDIFGVQSFDCAALAAGAVRVNPALPAALHFYAPVSPADFERALKALHPLYPEGHPVAWCAAQGIVRVTPLAEAARLHAEVSAGVVLFLEPGTRARSRWAALFEPRYRSPSISSQDYKRAPAWVKE